MDFKLTSDFEKLVINRHYEYDLKDINAVTKKLRSLQLILSDDKYYKKYDHGQLPDFYPFPIPNNVQIFDSNSYKQACEDFTNLSKMLSSLPNFYRYGEGIINLENLTYCSSIKDCYDPINKNFMQCEFYLLFEGGEKLTIVSMDRERLEWCRQKLVEAQERFLNTKNEECGV